MNHELRSFPLVRSGNRVLTLDDARPTELDKLNDPRVVWTSFTILDQAIDEMLDDK